MFIRRGELCWDNLIEHGKIGLYEELGLFLDFFYLFHDFSLNKCGLIDSFSDSFPIRKQLVDRSVRFF